VKKKKAYPFIGVLSMEMSLSYSMKMSNSIKGENKLEGASNFRSWKKRFDIILEKNKVLDLVKGM